MAGLMFCKFFDDIAIDANEKKAKQKTTTTTTKKKHDSNFSALHKLFSFTNDNSMVISIFFVYFFLLSFYLSKSIYFCGFLSRNDAVYFLKLINTCKPMRLSPEQVDKS